MLRFTGVSGKQEILDIRCIDHDVMSKNDGIGEVFYRLSELKPREEKDVWLNLTAVSTGRINLKLLLHNDGTLDVTCVCGRDLYAPDKWAPTNRDWCVLTWAGTISFPAH